MNELIQNIPKPLIDFLFVFCFSLLIGMEQRRHYDLKGISSFGTDRTFTFIGILGYILAMIPSSEFFIGGFASLTVLLAIFYFFKVKSGGGYGLTSTILALIVYCMPQVVINQPRWMTLLLYVLLLMLAELKGFFEAFSKQLDKDDFFTLSKFIIMAGIILPVLPNENIIPYLTISPYKIWLAVVVISSISYISYLLKKYIFPESGLIITGILGGLYSSTATTFIIARKSNEHLTSPGKYAGSVLFATAMMYFRIYVLMIIFNRSLARIALPYFSALLAVSLLTAWWIYKKKNSVMEDQKPVIQENRNPLEFKIALVFALLFVVFSTLTTFTLQYFGTAGLNILSFLVGFTDIDPFLMNLFQNTQQVTAGILAIATLQAVLSNNILKMIYGMTLSKNKVRILIRTGFIVNIAAGLIAIGILYLLNSR